MLITIIFQTITLPGNVSLKGPVDTSKFDGGKLTLGSIVSRVLNYVFPLAGLAMLIILILGGFEMLLSGGNPEKIKAGQAKVVSAIVGFVIIFAAYWLMEIVQTILGFKLLG